MAESTEREQKDLNTFQEETNSKTTEKEAVNVKVVEERNPSSTISLVYNADNDIAYIQAQAIIAVANLMENDAVSCGGVRPCNLDIAAAINDTMEMETNCGEISDFINRRASLTQCRLAADIAEDASADGRLVAAMAQDLLQTITSTIEVFQSIIHGFSVKALEATECGSERGYRRADFCHNMVAKYESRIEVLERKAIKIEAALKHVRDAERECQKHIALALEITDETLDESRLIKYKTCWWINKSRAAIIVCLKKEHSAVLMMRIIGNDALNEVEYEEPAPDSDEETQECQNRNRKTIIAHAITTFLGIALLSVTYFFKVGSDSFNAILASGLLTTGWCAIYWSHKFYTCLKERKERTVTEETTEATTELEEDDYLENCDRRLAILRSHLLKYNVVVDSDTESDTDTVETAAVGDDSMEMGAVGHSVETAAVGDD